MYASYRKYLLSSVAFAPPDPPNGGGDPPDDETLTLEDDAPEGEEAPEGDDAPEGEEGADDDAGGADDDDAEGDDEQPPSRGNRAVGALRADRRRLAEENATLTRQLDEMRRGSSTHQPQHQQQQETAQQRADRLALMSPAEQTTFLVNEALERHTAQQNAVNAGLMDQADSMAFTTATANNPLLRKVAGEVDQRLGALRKTGQNLPRMAVATYILGEKLLAQQGSKRPGAAQRRERERVAPRRAAGDVPADRRDRRSGNDVAAMERRLGDLQI